MSPARPADSVRPADGAPGPAGPSEPTGPVAVSTLGGIDGMAVGHWSDAEARTGVSVVVLPEGTTASAEVRGGAPATREFDVLAPSATVTRLDAVVLSGGSAFGLAAVDGVVATLAAVGRGFVTAGGVVPIVAGMSLFDLTVGTPGVRPGAAEGAVAARAALDRLAPPVAPEDTDVVGAAAATEADPALEGDAPTDAAPAGPVGAGMGATVSKWRGREHVVAGGLVTASITEGGFTVAALIAVNAFGDVVGHGPAEEPWPSLVPAEEVGAFGADASADGADGADSSDGRAAGDGAGTNTTLGAIVTDAALTKGECLLLAQGAHDGYARAITPPHCRVDGDAVVAAATGAVALAPADNPRRVAEVELLRWMAVRATADALATLAEVAPTGPIPWIDDPATSAIHPD